MRLLRLLSSFLALPRLNRLPRGATALLTLLLIGVLFGGSQRAFAQTGNATLTLTKEADPADGTNFTIMPTLVPAGTFGTFGTVAAQFSRTESIAVAPDGSVYVVDRYNNRIQKFDVAGNFLFMWGKDVTIGSPFDFEMCTTNCQMASQGGLAGELNGPQGVAVGPDGSVYVADTDNQRIQKFDALGNFVRMWGKDVAVGGDTDFEICTTNCQPGASDNGVGEFSYPTSLAVSSVGAVYVADRSNNRIQQFDAEGNFVRLWGWNVVVDVNDGFEICTTDCQAGSSGSAIGAMSSPESIAVAPDGSLYVADSFNYRIQQFDAVGNFVRMWGDNVAIASGTDFEICSNDCQVGESSSIGGGFGDPRDIAVGRDGAIYVVDHSNHRVQHFDATGNFVRAWGKDVDPAGGSGFEVCTANCQDGDDGSGAGELDLPYAIAVGYDGSIYVGDDNFRVQRYLGAAILLDEFPIDQFPFDDFDGVGQSVEIKGLPAATYSFRELLPQMWAMDDVNCSEGTLSFSPPNFSISLASNSETTCTVENLGPGSLLLGKEANSVAGTNFTFVPTLTHLNTAGSFGPGVGQLNFPDAVALDVFGTLYVADYGNHRIQRFDASGNFLGAFGSFGTGVGQFNAPTDIAMAPGFFGGFYVADFFNNRIQQYDGVGNFVRMWGRGVATGGNAFEVCTSACQVGIAGSGNGHFNAPSGVAVGTDGSVYVADFTNNRIQQFSATGDFIRTWGTAGIGNGQFNSPYAVTVSPAGTVFVIDSSNNRLQEFSATGTFLRVIGGTGSGAGKFNLPGRLAFAPDGSLWVTDINNHRIAQFDATGAFVRAFGKGVGGVGIDLCTTTCLAGSAGTGVGHFNQPYGIAIAPNGMIYVVDAGNHRLQRLWGAAIVLDDPVTDDGDGIFNSMFIGGLPPQSYTVSEAPLAGWALESVNCLEALYTVTEDAITLTVGSGIEAFCQFKNHLVHKLTVNKVVVGGGPLTADDFPLFVNGNPVVRGVATTFPVGQYTVTETPDPRYVASFGGACNASGVVNLGAGQSLVCTITNTLAASVNGTLWQDTNGNGTQDSGEAGVQGVTIILDTAPQSGEVGAFATLTTTTNAGGAYSFVGLAAGSYQVKIAPPAGMEFSQGSAAQQAKLAVAVASQVSPVAAGEAITYQIAYSNSGALAATGVVISTTIPAKTRIDLAKNVGWACAGGATVAGTLCSRSVADVAAGATGNATLRVEVLAETVVPTTVALTVGIRHATVGASALITLPALGSSSSVNGGLIAIPAARVNASTQTQVDAPIQEESKIFLPTTRK